MKNISLVGAVINKTCSTVFPENDFYEVELCVSEILNNIIEHTYKNNEDNYIDIDFNIIGNDININIYDNGKILDKDTENYINNNDLDFFDIDPDNIGKISERGRGLSIIKNLMDEFNYQNLYGKNQFSIKKRIHI